MNIIKHHIVKERKSQKKQETKKELHFVFLLAFIYVESGN